MKRITRKMH